MKTNFMGLSFSMYPQTYEEYKETKDGEIFEKLISDIILNKYSDDPNLTEFILSLPKEKQRLAMLSLIDKERKGDVNLLWSEMVSYVKDSVNKMEHIKDVIRIINKFVKDGEVEKKKHGEVMTPITLVREMLDTLPEDVWSNPNLKWLDPANGAGTFPFVVIYKLMNGLSEWEPDDEKRYKHIVENMIYTCELQSRNVFLWLCGVDPKDEYTTNTYWGSFLDEGFDKHMKDVWGLESIDIVIGNPPYNDGTKSQGKNSSLWTKFILKSYKIILNSNYILFVTPISWIAPSETQKNELKSIFFDNHLINLNTECSKYFDVASTFSYYLIEKTDTKFPGKTKINNDVYYNLNYAFLPNIVSSVTLSICDKFFFNKQEKLLFSSSLRNDDLSKDGPYKVWYANNLKCSNTLGKNYNRKKIVVNKPGYLNARYDNGCFNTSANNYWVEVESDKHAYNLLSFFKTNFSKLLLEKLCKYSGYNSLGVLKKLPVCLIDHEWDDDKIHDFFNFSNDEVNFINQNIPRY